MAAFREASASGGEGGAKAAKAPQPWATHEKQSIGEKMTNESSYLDHMDKWARNARLYQTLIGWGLNVEPVSGGEEHGGIEYLRVSVALIDQHDQG